MNGELVSEGQLLARLDPSDYQRSLDAANADLLKDELNYERAKELIKTGTIAAITHDDYYSKFEVFLNGRVDYLVGRNIQDVTSWFFEAIAQQFMSDTCRVEQMQNLYQEFMLEEAWR